MGQTRSCMKTTSLPWDWHKTGSYRAGSAPTTSTSDTSSSLIASRAMRSPSNIARPRKWSPTTSPPHDICFLLYDLFSFQNLLFGCHNLNCLKDSIRIMQTKSGKWFSPIQFIKLFWWVYFHTKNHTHFFYIVSFIFVSPIHHLKW